MFLLIAGSKKLYSKCFLSNTKKISQDRKKAILCALQAGFSEKNWNFSRKISLLETCVSNATLWIYENKTPSWEFSKKFFNYFQDFYLFSEPNNYCSDRAAPEQLSKYNWRNTVTLLKTLLKYRKCLKKQNFSPKVALWKNCFEKFKQISHKKTLRKSFLS